MFQFPTARFSRLVAVPVVAALMAGLWLPAHAQSAPDPDPQVRAGSTGSAGSIDRARANRGETLRGTIARVYGARAFDLRAEDGRTYRVELPVSVGLQSGTQVRVRGDLDGSNFYARTVTLGDFDDNGGVGNGNTNERALDIEGRVTRVNSDFDLEVRDDGGTTYRVLTDAMLSRSIRVGDRVQTRGSFDGRVMRVASVRAIDNSAGNQGYGIYVDFPATIESIDLDRQEARVRADNGYSYTIRARRALLDDFRVGQRVRVKGNWAYERVEVSDISRAY